MVSPPRRLVSRSRVAGKALEMADEPQPYLVERVQRALAEDPRVSALDLDVTVAGDRVFLTGEVATAERRRAVTDVVRALLPDHEVMNETTVAHLAPAGDAEDIA